MKHSLYAAAVALVTLSGCSQNPGWEVKGVVEGAEPETRIALEGYNNGLWYVVDSIDVDASGKFAYRASAPAAFPDVMRITLDSRSIYFPVDSVDCLEISTTASDFGTKYAVSGTAAAKAMYSIDSILNAEVVKSDASQVRGSRDLKQRLFNTAFADPSIVSVYYLINKSVGGESLFDLSDPQDLRVYGAVAQRFKNERPDDPRTAYLESTYIAARNALSNQVTEITVPESSIIEIERADIKGVKHKLSEVVAKGNVVLLSFTSYGLETSPAYTVVLNDLWNQYHASGLDIYQVAFDSDESLWKIHAANMPWTAVWNSTTDGAQVLAMYNVGSLPMTYIIDRHGDLVERVNNPSELESKVKKYL